MKAVRILSIRKNTDPRITSLEADFVKLLSRQCEVRVEDIRMTYSDAREKDKVLLKEAELFEKRFMLGEKIIALHAGGKSYTSEEFADWMKKERDGGRNLTFLIGGPFGLHERVFRRADAVLSLSKMTLTHELARLFLLEALYRSSTLSTGGKYHK